MARELFKEDKDIRLVVGIILKGQSITDVDHHGAVKRVADATGYEVEFLGLEEREKNLRPTASPEAFRPQCGRCETE